MGKSSATYLRYTADEINEWLAETLDRLPVEHLHAFFDLGIWQRFDTLKADDRHVQRQPLSHFVA